jgi:peptidoglycan/LPS O-acetylase OafA/YrhL
MTTERSQSPRLKELDALRGMAALGVVLYHFTGHFGRLHGHSAAVPFTFEIGSYGVHLFFVISGFVIFMTLEHTKRALDFVVSRFSRLFPAYWAALAITLTVVHLAGLPGQEISRRDALVNLTMLSDFLGAAEADGSYWTLQIELFFYAQMLCWYMVGALDSVRLIIAGWLTLTLAYGLEARDGIPLSYLVREVAIVRFICFFAAGVLLYRLHQQRDRSWQSAALLAGCVLGVWIMWSWREALVLAFCVAVFFLFILGKLRFLARQPFVLLGALSYTLYLIHQSIGFIIIAHLERVGLDPGPSIALALAAVLALAGALTLFVERPVMRGIRAAYVRWRERSKLRAMQGTT